MPNLPGQLNKLRERLEREKCPNHIPHNKRLPRGPSSPATSLACTCCGTGLNPAYDALRKVVREKCPEPATSWQHPGYDIGRSFACERCDGTTYITRSIEGWPPKALEGALAYGIDHIIENHDNSLRWTRCYRQLIDMIDMGGDTREAAVAAVMEVLKETSNV